MEGGSLRVDFGGREVLVDRVEETTGPSGQCRFVSIILGDSLVEENQCSTHAMRVRPPDVLRRLGDVVGRDDDSLGRLNASILMMMSSIDWRQEGKGAHGGGLVLVLTITTSGERTVEAEKLRGVGVSTSQSQV